VILKESCDKLHHQKSFELKHISYEISTSPQNGIKSPFSSSRFPLVPAGIWRSFLQIKPFEKDDLPPPPPSGGWWEAVHQSADDLMEKYFNLKL